MQNMGHSRKILLGIKLVAPWPSVESFGASVVGSTSGEEVVRGTYIDCKSKIRGIFFAC